VKSFSLETAANLGWINSNQVALALKARATNPSMDTCQFMLQQGWLEVQHVEWLRREAAGHILRTAANQGWLTAEQITFAIEALGRDPTISIYDFLLHQRWLNAEQIAWIQQHEAARQEPPAENRARTDQQGSAGGTAQAQAVDEADLLPSDAEFPVKLGSDHALDHLNDYLRLGIQYGASDVHIGVAAPPMMRLHGCLQIMWPRAPKFVRPQTERLLMEFLTDAQRERLKNIGDLDFCYEVPELGRFRTSVVRQRLGFDGVFRIINSKVRTMDELGLPQQLKALTHYHNGLILVTGAVGCGKSTTLAALVEEVNSSRSDHIVTLEDPIEYVFEAKGCHITQREVHTHTESFARALKATLREDPDVIMVGEMRDLETIALAITAAETGHLVFGTLHTSTAARTLDRVLDVFPIEQQAQIRVMVAGSLRGILTQQLIPRADGRGRVLALEILINFPAVGALIREAKTFMLPGFMQTGRKLGCRLMDDSLFELLDQKMIMPQEAYERAQDKELFKKYL
jgi:twitching motility protein PilT